MAEYPKEVRLPTGEDVVVRPLERTDEQSLLRFFKEVPDQDRLFLKEDVTDPTVVKRWVENIDLERIYPLLAFEGDEVVGDATLHRNPFGWSKHVAEIRVVVAEAWRRKSVAQVLVNELVSRAHTQGIEILEAHILEGQYGAQRALESLGFAAETVLRSRATDRTGRRRNIIVMTNDVSELWRRMEELVTELDVPSGRGE